MSLRGEVGDALRDIAPAMIAACPIGLLYGALAVSKGLSPAEVALTSAFVFAGGAQFAALGIWAVPAPIAALAFSTLLINARHVLMGASLVRHMGAFRPWHKWVGFAVMADENWAMAERRAGQRPLRPAYFLGMGAIFWCNWLLWSVAGAFSGSVLGDPSRFGADFAFTALFIGLVAGFWRGRRTAWTVMASAMASAAVFVAVGPPWHVLAGAIAGLVVAYATAEPA